jgi:iron complex transport system substrate-binding protein
MRDATAVGAVVVLVAMLGVVPVAAGAGMVTGTSGSDGSALAATDAGQVGSAPAGARPAAVSSQEACSFPVTVTDATGTAVTVEEEPERIVTLSPSAAQTLWEFDATEKVVGVSDNAAYLEGSGEKEVVTDGQTIRTEVIVGLEPDLVLAPDVVPDEDVATLREQGLTVYNANASTDFADVYAKTEQFGRVAGECGAANATVTDMRERVNAVRDAVADEEPVGSLYVFFGFTTGGGTFIDSIITTAGPENVAAEAGITGFAELSREVVANNSEEIEWLILNDNPTSHPSGDVYNETAAVRNDQVVVIDQDWLNQPAPRTVWALENLTRAVYPDAYEEAQASLEATPTATPTAMPTDAATPTETASTDTPTATPDPVTTETTDEVTTGSGPGFTAVAAALAALAVALVARRRR